MWTAITGLHSAQGLTARRPLVGYSQEGGKVHQDRWAALFVAELLGHARLETTRAYTRPSAEDRTRALDLLLVDK